MRLIDADALREEVNSHGPYERADQPDWETVKSVLTAIDAAPTVSCEECEYGEDGDCLHPDMLAYPNPEDGGMNFAPPATDFGCPYFERRTP
jgi:hypothetical protein